MTHKPKLIKKTVIDHLKKARKHLEYSYQKVINIILDAELSEQELETLESFSSRFARYSDFIISRYFRLLALEKDPAFDGSVTDLLNIAEKYTWIESAETWKHIRELRNVAAYEYEAEDYKKLYQELILLVPSLYKISLTL